MTDTTFNQPAQRKWVVHVIHLTDYLHNVGGAELSAWTIARELSLRENVQVSVVGVKLPSRDVLDFGNANVHPVGLPGTIESVPDGVADLVVSRLLARKVERLIGRADVMHAHQRRGAFALGRIDSPVPAIGTVRDFWPVCPISVYSVRGRTCNGCDHCLDECVAYQGWDGPTSPLVKRYLFAKRRSNRRQFRQLDHAVYLAEHLRASVEEALAPPHPSSTKIHEPIEFPDVEPSDEPSDRARFVTASALTLEKGIDTAVRAIGRVAESHPEVALDIFGSGERREALVKLAAKHCPGGTVRFRGHVAPAVVYESMHAATATIFPSRWAEPFGRVTAESMYLGTPVVGSDRGGIAEIIDDGETGLLFPVDDDAALAECLTKLIENQKMRDTLAARGPAAAERFSAANIVDEHLALYNRLIG